MNISVIKQESPSEISSQLLHTLFAGGAPSRHEPLSFFCNIIETETHYLICFDLDRIEGAASKDKMAVLLTAFSESIKSRAQDGLLQIALPKSVMAIAPIVA